MSVLFKRCKDMIFIKTALLALGAHKVHRVKLLRGHIRMGRAHLMDPTPTLAAADLRLRFDVVVTACASSRTWCSLPLLGRRVVMRSLTLVKGQGSRAHCRLTAGASLLVSACPDASWCPLIPAKATTFREPYMYRSPPTRRDSGVRTLS